MCSQWSSMTIDMVYNKLINWRPCDIHNALIILWTSFEACQRACILLFNFVLEFQNIPAVSDCKIRRLESSHILPDPAIECSMNMLDIVLLTSRNLIPSGLVIVNPLSAGTELIRHGIWSSSPDRQVLLVTAFSHYYYWTSVDKTTM